MYYVIIGGDEEGIRLTKSNVLSTLVFSAGEEITRSYNKGTEAYSFSDLNKMGENKIHQYLNDFYKDDVQVYGVNSLKEKENESKINNNRKIVKYILSKTSVMGVLNGSDF